MKETLEQLSQKYEDMIKTYYKLLGYDRITYEKKLLTEERRIYYNAALVEFNFAISGINTLLKEWEVDDNINKLNLSILIQREFNRYRDCPLAPEDKGKVEALFIIIDGLKKIVKETETEK